MCALVTRLQRGDRFVWERLEHLGVGLKCDAVPTTPAKAFEVRVGLRVHAPARPRYTHESTTHRQITYSAT